MLATSSRPAGSGLKRTGYYVTGLTWSDYEAGQRDRFPSWQVQAEMLALWPTLFEGFFGDLPSLHFGWPDARAKTRTRMVFGKALQKELAAGLWLAEGVR